MPVYSIEPKSVKRFSENPVSEQKHRESCGLRDRHQSQNSSNSLSAPAAFWVNVPLPTAVLV
jgi:hypothetical protein